MFYPALILVIYLVSNGLTMVIAPLEWYHAVPGVSHTGGFNAHFIRDIGFMFVLSGGGVAWRLVDATRGKAAALIASGFLLLHASYHLVEMIFTNQHGHFLGLDLVAIYLPALVSLTIVTQKDLSLPRWFQRLTVRIAHKGIIKFENSFDYDAAYMHDIADVDIDGIARFSLLEELGAYRKNIPISAWYASKLISCISEDCGPCTQLVVTMAEREGVSENTLSAVVEGRREELDEETKLFFDYAHAVLAHDPGADTYRKKITIQFGPAALISASLALITGRSFPLMKYAMGHGQACVKVQINGEHKAVNKGIFLPQGAQ